MAGTSPAMTKSGGGRGGQAQGDVRAVDAWGGGGAGQRICQGIRAGGPRRHDARQEPAAPERRQVARRVVEGKAEFGLTLSGEVASVPGAVIAGPLPPPFGQDTIYVAAAMAASLVKEAAAA